MPRIFLVGLLLLSGCARPEAHQLTLDDGTVCWVYPGTRMPMDCRPPINLEER